MGRAAQKVDANTLAAEGPLVVADVFPKVLPIGGGQKDGLILASGLYERDDLGAIVPKKDLVCSVMDKKGEKPDEGIEVEKIATDDIVGGTVKIKVTVPPGYITEKGQKRHILLRKKYEIIDPEKGCISDKNCYIAKDVVMLD